MGFIFFVLIVLTVYGCESQVIDRFRKREKKERRDLSFFLVTAGGAASTIVSAGTIIA